MNSPISYPLIKTALAVATGILLQAYLPPTFPWTGMMIAVLFVLVLLFLVRKWSNRLCNIESLGIWVLFSVCGAEASVLLPNEVYHPQEGNIQGTFWCEHVELKEKLVVAEGLLHDTHSTFQIKVVLFTTEPDTVTIRSGFTHFIEGKLSLFRTPDNPFQFDQKAYNESKGFSAQLIASEIHLLEQTALSSFKQSSKSWIHEQFNPIAHAEVRALLIAFTTGDKSGLSSETKRSFSNAGVMHLLAVSGLHVSLVPGVPLLLLKRSRKKYFRIVWFTLALTTVWLYAWLTGFQASVLRAATMLSLIGLAQVLRTQTSSINQLGAAATFILLAEPTALFTVGFQLSFSAVAAILLWAPVLSKRYKTQRGWLNKIINGLCVSTAAQAGSSPLSIYYFHSFPTLFLLANLIAIPLATILLYGALIVLLLGSFGVHFEWVFVVVEWLGCALFGFSNWIASFSFACVEGLYLSHFEVIALYFFMLSFFKLISLKRKERSYRVSLVAAAMLMVCFSFRQVPFLEMTVFTGSKSVVVGVRNEQTATLYATGPFRKGASSGWVNRYGAKVIEVTGDTLLPSPFFFWTKGNEFGVEHLLFSENLAQKKSVAWDGVVVRQKRTWNSWELVVPYERCLAETIVTYGKASCFRFNSDGLPVGECNQHSFPIGTAHSKEE